MNSDPAKEFFSPLLAVTAELWGKAAEVSSPCVVLGALGQAGGSRPLPSSAIRISMGVNEKWIPCPLPPFNGQAGIFLHAGRKLVMPVVRLCVHEKGKSDESNIEFVTPGEWIADALKRWRFPSRKRDETDSPRTILEALRSKDERIGLRVLAQVVRYALLGTTRAGRYAIADGTNLRLPECPRWLRSFDDTPLGEASARSTILTARLLSDDKPFRNRWPEFIPRQVLAGSNYQINPKNGSERGIDPVHTTEGSGIRLTGRLGHDVKIEHRKLKIPNEHRAALSISTAQIPYAGYDDPRRLLMAATMQAQAVMVNGNEPPCVRGPMDFPDARPLGVNLRVGYMAWRGLNHEDSWVISDQAASRLTRKHEVTVTIPVGSLELPAKVLVEPGTYVHSGQQLVERSCLPLLLASSFKLFAQMNRFDANVILGAEPQDIAPWSGRVVSVEIWDFIRNKVLLATEAGLQDKDYPPDYFVPKHLLARYRQLIRLTLERELPLRVGDKLANRHGHKGIVGAILPATEMPRWNGQPLEALIDPISVLNRSNWGQIYETLEGAGLKPNLGMKSGGCTVINPPVTDEWMTGSCKAVAGVQFVMRMPQNANDRISASPSPDTRALRDRAQRFGEMDYWALWAHKGKQSGKKMVEPRLSKPAEQLKRLLAMAGYGLSMSKKSIELTQLALDGDPPSEAEWIKLSDLTLPEAREVIAAVRTEQQAVLIFDPPVSCDLKMWGEDRLPSQKSGKICWLPVVPLNPDRQMPEDRADERHPLTQALWDVARAADDIKKAIDTSQGTEKLNQRLQYELGDLMALAYDHAVGSSATGSGNSKYSVLRRRVLGHRHRPSARATAAPAGTNGLGLDEVGVPSLLLKALMGREFRYFTDEQLSKHLKNRWFWIKRDPVLHRWGLLPVRAKLIEGDVIRLPASLLSPMGADFDGDTIALFATLPGQLTDFSTCRPSTMAWDSTTKRAMFLPAKQYRYGLGRLHENGIRLKEFQQDLISSGAPKWNDSVEPQVALEEWVHEASRPDANGDWWRIIEEHAIAAFADEPGMQFGLMPAEKLAELNLVRWGAAKRDIFEKNQADAWAALQRILDGKSLSPYTPDGVDIPDPIAKVMVVAKASVGRFGGVQRRMIYSANELKPETIRDIQTLTEQATQRTLSVKAGKEPMPFDEYNKKIPRPPVKKGGMPADQSKNAIRPLNKEVADFFESMGPVCERIQSTMDDDQPLWLKFLKDPEKLASFVQSAKDGKLSLPMSDLRVQPFVELNNQ